MDVACALAPFVPAVGAVRHAGKIDDVADLVKGADKVEGAVDAGKSVDKVSDAGKLPNTANKGTIYRVPGSDTPSGKPYIGRHNRPEPQKTRRSPDGRDRSNAEVIDSYNPNNVTEGRIKEQQAINKEGGIKNLDNKRNEISPKEQHNPD